VTNLTRSGDATMVKDLYRYIWKVSARGQVILSSLSVAVFLLGLAPLELQRRIVNSAVDHRDFQFIVMLCLIYVAVALVHGTLKLVLNVYRSSVSEAANQRLRMLIDPTATADSVTQNGSGEKGVKISIVVSEVEAVGGFVGCSFCDPLLNAGILLSVFGYMLFMQPWMALVALLIFCPQLLFIPFLQRAINLRTKRRIEKLRAISVDIVNEGADGEEHTKKSFMRRIRDVYRLNMQIFRRKFGMISLMNLLYTLGVIGILAVGAWLLLQGRTDVGTIVAFISGLALMNDPWRDLVNYFRDMTNAGLKYRMINAELDERSTEPA
jgi:ABC-type multidrug transport system fused ATPase/permease subunit